MDELELEPPPPPWSSDELELLLLLLEELLPVELELVLLEELASEELATLLDELEEDTELLGADGSVGLPPPHPESVPTPRRAAPPDSRIRKSRRSDLRTPSDGSFV